MKTNANRSHQSTKRITAWIILLAFHFLCGTTTRGATSFHIIALTNSWNYNQSGNDLRTAWKEKNYDDSGWASGRGLLALEDNSLITPLTNTVLSLTNPSGQRVITYYFRTRFNFPTNSTGFNLVFSSYMDDGGVIYLNGSEVRRVRVADPPATIRYGDFAASPSGGDATAPDVFVIAGALATNLIAGDNVLAVEVHQTNTTSSDIVFGMAVEAVHENSFRWALQAGGNDADTGRNVALDGTGNIYIYGAFVRTASFGSTNLTSGGVAGQQNSFLAKYNPNRSLIWLRQQTGTGNVYPNGMAVDAGGNAYVTAPFNGTLTIGGTNLVSSGQTDGVIAKYDNAGNVLWVRQAGGTGHGGMSRIAIDAAGNAYVSGNMVGSVNFSGTILTNFSAVTDMFVAKYGSDGTLQWVRRAGGHSVGSIGPQSVGVTADAAGNNYVTAVLQGMVKFGDTNIINITGTNAFLAKHDASGNLQWFRQISGGVLDGAAGFNERGCAVDPSGNVYLVSNFKGVASLGSFSLTNTGGYDVFVAKYDPDGNIRWAQQANGTTNDAARNIAVDSGGNVFIAGQFNGTTTFGMTRLINRGGGDVFVAKLDTDGDFLWVKQGGGSDADYGIGIATDDCGSAFVSGSFSANAVFGSTNLTSRGGTDVFVTRIDDELPTLSIAIAGNEVLASWPSSSRCFRLESTPSLASSNSWNPVDLPSTRIGKRNVVTNQLLGGAQFYRLRGP